MKEFRKYRKYSGIAILSAVFIFLSAGCGIMPEEEEKLAPPLAKPVLGEYNLYQVVRKDIAKSVKGIGNLAATNDKPISFKRSGMRLKSINVNVGDKVKKGVELVLLEGGNIDIQIKQKQYDIQRKELSLNYLKEKYAEYKSAVELSQNIDLRAIENDIKIKQIDLEEANMLLNDLKKQAEDFKVVAPIDGVITFKDTLQEGDAVEAYKTILTISDTKGLQVYYQNEAVKDVKNGMDVKVTYRGKEYIGDVIFSPDSLPMDQAQAVKLKNAVLISAKDLPTDAVMGDTVSVEIPLQSKTNAIVVPANCVKNFMGQKTVMVMDGNSKKELSVETGISTATEVEIVSGLEEGQSVIIQ